MPAVEEADNRLPEDILRSLGTRYSSIAYVSSGATSAVYSAHDNVLDKRVAIKVLMNSGASDLISFQTEAKSAGKLDHKNLVATLDFGITSENTAYLIMGFVDGESLESILQQRGRLPVALAMELLKQICEGLAYAHSKKIAHRDLKATNVIVRDVDGDSPLAIIVDFGLARERSDQDETQTINGQIVGSPLYMSPEQALGQHGDERSDIYSLACIAYKMVSGHTPFESDDLFLLLRMHVDESPQSLAALAPDVELPEGLEGCVACMLAKDPLDRFQSTIALQETLRGIRYSEPEPIEPTALERLTSPNFKRGLVPILVLVLVSSLLLLLGYSSIKQAEKGKAGTDHMLLSGENLKIHQSRSPFRTRISEIDFMGEPKWPHVEPEHASSVTDDQLKYLQGIDVPNYSVSLANSSITGTGLKYLNSKNIKTLDLTSTKLTEAGYSELAKLTNLELLGLGSSAVRDADIAKVAMLPNLKTLSLNNCKQLTDQACQYLGQMSSLKQIDLSSVPITDRGVKALSQCKTIERVTFDDDDLITDDGFSALTNVKRLKGLQVNFCKHFTVKSLRTIVAKHGASLDSLDLSRTNLVPSDIALLKDCRALTRLCLAGIPLTDAEMVIIGRFHNMSVLSLSELKCKESVLVKQIGGLKTLNSLTIFKTPLTAKAREELAMRLTTRTPCLIVTDYNDSNDAALSPQANEIFDLYRKQE